MYLLRVFDKLCTSEGLDQGRDQARLYLARRRGSLSSLFFFVLMSYSTFPSTKIMNANRTYEES